MKKNLLKFAIILIALILIGLAIYFFAFRNFSNSSENFDNFAEQRTPIINSDYLYLADFEINNSNGISNLTGNIYNDSNEESTNVICHVELFNSDNSLIYEFDLELEKIPSYDSTNFSYTLLIDLSNVANYNFSIVE